MKIRAFAFAAAAAATVLALSSFSAAGVGAESAAPAAPAAPALTAEQADALKARVYSRINMRATEVRPAPVPGLFEVVSGRKLFYVDEKVDHLVMGRIFDVVLEKDLTSERLE
ncbi:MAG: hypothetical protein HUK26_07205, partial [Duodenibacillus sp.]|nr:hypothetical protein [Duodenibacillus sp.]